ncbi:MAG: response regulator, partial [Anaerolineae bacterium]|nr:response regulator [Anaerolineae bacterium]
MPEKILIIDDDLDTLRLVGLMLQKKGYEIAAANNGKQGLLKVAEDIPDLILLDVMMPEMDGYEVARRLRQDPQTENIPILMFTAKSQLNDKVTGFEAGADDYLTKPTHPAELQAHVKALLARSVKVDNVLPQRKMEKWHPCYSSQ